MLVHQMVWFPPISPSFSPLSDPSTSCNAAPGAVAQHVSVLEQIQLHRGPSLESLLMGAPNNLRSLFVSGDDPDGEGKRRADDIVNVGGGRVGVYLDVVARLVFGREDVERPE